MGWMQKLYETYENCSSEIGVLKGGRTPLLPIFHTTQKAQVEAVIDIEGNWCPGRARVLTDRNEQTTIIPCTEKSAIRTSGPEPHPLFDKLKYIAGDYGAYRTEKNSSYPEYIRQLSDWCASPGAHPKVRAVLEYLKKGSLMHDLSGDGILYTDEEGRLSEKWTGAKENMPLIFRVCAGDQADAFVRFQVIQADGSEDLHSCLWEDRDVWQSYIDYQTSLPSSRSFCYVLGKEMPVSTLSPKNIRRPGDGAKLISSNDNSGFTYRGRFQTPTQAFCIGRETTEKAHSALRWLISKQASINGDQVILAWGTNGWKAPDPCAGTLDFILGAESDMPVISTREEFASRFHKAIAGYSCHLEDGDEAIIMGMDSATPGRLSIFYYREIQAKDLLERMKSWYRTCSWILYDCWQAPKGLNGRTKPVWASFEGTPAPKDIVEAAYGAGAMTREKSKKLLKSTVERLLPCIVDGACLPVDLMRGAARRASNPVIMENREARKTLGIACALIRKYYNDQCNSGQIIDENYREVWKMGLNTEEDDRDYLFGRALAYAQKIESFALGQSDEKRSTNAERLQTAFSQHPARIWKTLNEQLRPYLMRLGPKANQYVQGMNEVISRIPKEKFTNDSLSELYLLGYSCQMQKFYEEKQENTRKKNANSKNDDEGEEI